MLKDLVKLANHLDSKGLVKEADYLDRIIKSASGNPLQDKGKARSIHEHREHGHEGVRHLCSLYFSNARESDLGDIFYDDIMIDCTIRDNLVESFKSDRPMTFEDVKEKINEFNAKYDPTPTWTANVSAEVNNTLSTPVMDRPHASPQPKTNPVIDEARKNIIDFFGKNYII